MRKTSAMIKAAAASGKSPSKVKWEDDIKNPENEEYVNEVAFNLDIDPKDVTQDQFNQRYLQEEEENENEENEMDDDESERKSKWRNFTKPGNTKFNKK
jgi:hypothetical protein